MFQDNFDKSEEFFGTGYYKLKLSITEQRVFEDNLKDTCDLKHLKLRNDAEMCLKSEPPKTDIGQFYLDKRKQLVFDKFVQEDTSRTYGYLGTNYFIDTYSKLVYKILKLMICQVFLIK